MNAPDQSEVTTAPTRSTRRSLEELIAELQAKVAALEARRAGGRSPYPPNRERR